MIVPSATWWASVLPAVWLGAEPVFAESEPARGGLDPDDVERRVTPRTRAVVVVHLWGMPSRMTELLEEYAIAAPSSEVPASVLSGGNQQRVVVARELSRRPRVIVAENPTRGLDIRATASIHERLGAAAASGGSAATRGPERRGWPRPGRSPSRRC